MKTPVKEEQFLTDAKGNRTAIVLDLKTYERLREAQEELEDIRTYDALHDRAHSEISGGQYATLENYRTRRARKAK